MLRTSDAANLVLEGIPEDLRQELWMVFSGAIHEKNLNPGKYQELVEEVRY
jgi:TBC1 domain family member 8/9